MKIISLVLLTILLALPAMAVDSPIHPEAYKYFRQNPRATGPDGKRIAKARYVITSTSAAGKGATGSYGLGVTLPAGAVITRSYYKVTQAITGVTGSTIAFSCEDANNIKTATNMVLVAASTHADDSFVEGASTGTAATFVRGIAARCEITAAVATEAMSTGAWDLWIEYNVETE